MRPRRARVTAGALLGFAAFALMLSIGVASAFAQFRPIRLQSVGDLEQFEEAGESVISANGQYLAFQGTLAGTRGVWRKELSTGALELVAGGSIYAHASETLTAASAPSISADGRYVSFTTEAALVKAAHPGSNVYVRDMSLATPPAGACSEAEEAQKVCPYELASELNESSEGLAYGNGGAVASGRVALSASGREVAFVTQGGSDLASRNPSQLTTPALQVLVRYLDTDKTVLVSAEREPTSETQSKKPAQCLAEGAGEAAECPVQGGAITPTTEFGTRENATRALPGAALSGDGSTVAWLGAHIPAQAPTLHGEREKIEEDDKRASENEAYDEPLWRRIADGPSAPTRRMVGGGDPLAPGCPANGELKEDACQGPYPNLAYEFIEGAHNRGWLTINQYDGVPQLSENGWTAALVGNPSSTSNVFVVNMSEGLDRVQALRQLTREVPVPGVPNPGTNISYVATAGDVYSVAISPDGSRIAFTTQRDQFPLAPPNFTEPPLTQLGLVELYEINLDEESIARMTHGPDHGPALLENKGNSVTESGASTPSFTGDDLTVAFADTASNLVYGDANRASDVFTTVEEPQTEIKGSVQIGPVPPSQEPGKPQWTLSVVPITHSNGSLTLQVTVPGAGELRATANAVVPVTAKSPVGRGRAHGDRRAHGDGRAHGDARGDRKKRGSAARTRLQARSVGSASMPASLPGVLELPLRVAARYAGLLQTSAGIYTTVKVTFVGRGGPTLTQTVTVSLHDTQKKKPRHATHHGSDRSTSKHGKRRGR